MPSGQALLRMADAARAKGVNYIFGDAGYVKRLVYDSAGTCKGVVTADGTTYEADIVLLASGANTATLIDAGQEVVAQCSVICVMKLEPEEIAKYQDIPIIDDFEQGDLYPIPSPPPPPLLRVFDSPMQASSSLRMRTA